MRPPPTLLPDLPPSAPPRPARRRPPRPRHPRRRRCVSLPPEPGYLLNSSALVPWTPLCLRPAATSPPSPRRHILRPLLLAPTHPMNGLGMLTETRDNPGGAQALRAVNMGHGRRSCTVGARSNAPTSPRRMVWCHLDSNKIGAGPVMPTQISITGARPPRATTASRVCDFKPSC